MTASEISFGVWGVYTATVSVGGSAVEVFGDYEVTAASSGVVVATIEPSGGASSSTTSGAEKVMTACWAGLVVCGILFSLL